MSLECYGTLWSTKHELACNAGFANWKLAPGAHTDQPKHVAGRGLEDSAASATAVLPASLQLQSADPTCGFPSWDSCNLPALGQAHLLTVGQERLDL
mmetsp:Transcript_1863/g.5227  ORF Transcript_1863/g.5227 Transcript_1863/m.5227 type:complete len:97 (+) Transcript_1863:110-400(+)